MPVKVFVDTNIWLYALIQSNDVVAAALDAGCAILYSEDMQHGQQVDGQLTILNPFKD